MDAYAKIGLGHLSRTITLINQLLKQSSVEIILLVEFDQVSRSIFESRVDNEILVIDKNNLSEEEFLLSNINTIKPDKIYFDIIYDYSLDFITSIKEKAEIIFFQNNSKSKFKVDKFILPSIHNDNEYLNDSRWKEGELSILYHGSNYVIFNDSLEKYRSNNLIQKEKIKKIIVTTGGSDPEGVMLKLLSFLNGSEYEIFALIGVNFIKKDELEILKRELSSNIHLVDFDYSYFEDCDLVISTFGVTTYELVYLGIPILSVGHAIPNARGSAVMASKISSMIDLGLSKELNIEHFQSSLSKIKKDYSTFQKRAFLNKDVFSKDAVKNIIDLILK
ncbi:hypothetical protein MY04_2867 [Flammeovirga sp. MY04]|nr:hypothetical protein MY04_2867 [Flammeovirga sp. MY04]